MMNISSIHWILSSVTNSYKLIQLILYDYLQLLRMELGFRSSENVRDAFWRMRDIHSDFFHCSIEKERDSNEVDRRTADGWSRLSHLHWKNRKLYLCSSQCNITHIQCHHLQLVSVRCILALQPIVRGIELLPQWTTVWAVLQLFHALRHAPCADNGSATSRRMCRILFPFCQIAYLCVDYLRGFVHPCRWPLFVCWDYKRTCAQRERDTWRRTLAE